MQSGVEPRNCIFDKQSQVSLMHVVHSLKGADHISLRKPVHPQNAIVPLLAGLGKSFWVSSGFEGR